MKKNLFKLLFIMSFLSSVYATDVGEDISNDDITTNNIKNITLSIEDETEITKKSIKKWLENEECPLALSKNLFTSSGKIDPNKIKIKDISNLKGNYSERIFSISINTNLFDEKKDYNKKPKWKNKFIIKKLIPSSALYQINNLCQVKESKVASLTNYSINSKTYPFMTFDEINFQQKNGLNKTSYYSILHAAQGKALSSLEDLEKKEGYFFLGKALANMHLKYAKFSININSYNFSFDNFQTIVHGDLHSDNIFFDSLSKRIYFIDNERMAKSVLKLQLIDKDIDVIGYSILGKDVIFSDNSEIYLINFLKGYVSQFPSQLQKSLKNYISRILENTFNLYLENSYNTKINNILNSISICSDNKIRISKLVKENILQTINHKKRSNYKTEIKTAQSPMM